MTLNNGFFGKTAANTLKKKVLISAKHFQLCVKLCLAGSACSYIKKGTLEQVFSCEFCETSNNTFLLIVKLIVFSVKRYLNRNIRRVEPHVWNLQTVQSY